jgi:hypothetical protein
LPVIRCCPCRPLTYCGGLKAAPSCMMHIP